MLAVSSLLLFTLTTALPTVPNRDPLYDDIIPAPTAMILEDPLPLQPEPAGTVPFDQDLLQP